MEKGDKIIHDFSEANKPDKSNTEKPKLHSMNSKKPPVVLFVVLLLLGIGTGFLVSKAVGSSTVTTVGPNGKTQTTTATTGQIYGSQDAKDFKDSAEGTLRVGGIDGEGAYHLERPGGDSQNVYLTSSSVDLSTFVGKKVKVWGETNSAQKAGWLMDVGRLQLL
ncbi:MAG TPA: hypothetical protein VG965_04970 [Patescibacteria group bacterium]|nr:hypothetical protein [Patescibacteria group bacterium]